uniref:mRNA (guanine-N(7))-methyltransferase n=1 Tax=Arcella intermedia TaxID=1963864 RepID=A0A6B2LA97_9EUKA
MDGRKAVRELYEKSHTPSMRERAEGPGIKMKKFHNNVKRQLIYQFAWGAPCLLDLCCGRGGDLQKWYDAKVRYVKGIDIAAASIEEAQRRYIQLSTQQGAYKPSNRSQPQPRQQPNSRQYRQPSPPPTFKVDFLVSQQLGREVLFAEDVGRYEAISCMFALHYFFESESILDCFLRTVGRCLKRGGHFLGCCPDGARIAALLGDQEHYEDSVVRLTKLWRGERSACGSAYGVSVLDTVIEGRSEEYLVDFEYLAGKAAQHGLFPVSQFTPSLQGMLEGKEYYKHFKPNWGLGYREWEQYSRMNAVFVFRKS